MADDRIDADQVAVIVNKAERAVASLAGIIKERCGRWTVATP